MITLWLRSRAGAFEKFPGVDAALGPQMKAIGEVMALGRTFPEALNKAVQSLEIGVDALDGSGSQQGYFFGIR